MRNHNSFERRQVYSAINGTETLSRTENLGSSTK